MGKWGRRRRTQTKQQIEEIEDQVKKMEKRDWPCSWNDVER